MLGDARMDLALTTVNHEALEVVLAWAAGFGIEARQVDGQGTPVLLRAFNTEIDIMYVSGEWDDFLGEPASRPWELEEDFTKRTYSDQCRIGRLAVAEGLFRRSEMPLLGQVWDYYNCLDVLYVVVGQQPSTSNTQDGTGVQRTYRVDESQAWALVWEGSDEGAGGEWFVKNEDRIFDKFLHQRLVEAGKNLRVVDGSPLQQGRDFEIRVVWVANEYK